MSQREPYAYFFPAALFCGVTGVLIWLPWLSGHFGAYPGQLHPELMVGGFLTLYTLGFLTTAIPRFTGTEDMSSSELKVAALLVTLLGLGFLFSQRMLFLFSDISILVYMAIYAYQRVRRRKANPPPTFAFIGLGIILGLLGLSLQGLIELGVVKSDLLPGARALFFIGYVLSLILGIGSRLLPALMGHQPIPIPLPPLSSASLQMKEFVSLIPKDLIASAFLFALSFIPGILPLSMAPILPIALGDLLRALITTWIGIKYWQVTKRPVTAGFQSHLLWISTWSLIVSQYGMAFFPQFRLHAFHWLAISGMGLMTIMISTRVTLSHSGQDMSAEKKSKALLASGVLILLAALVRLCAALDLAHYERLLLLASLLWTTGLLVWALRFARYWLVPAHQHFDKK